MHVGILGGGQLARMLILSGYPLGMRFRVWSQKQSTSTSALAETRVFDPDDNEALDAFLEGLDVVTFEWENIPVAMLERIATKVPVHPSASALAPSQDRLKEKELFRELGIATADFAAVDSAADLSTAAKTLGLPAILKTRRLGYDGKGQTRIDSEAELGALLAKSPSDESLRGMILEKVVPFALEMSIVVTRTASGECVTYSLAENRHEGGILRHSFAPAPGASSRLEKTAAALAQKVAEKLDYVGTLAIELFALEDDTLIANEMAPRVHNSGHWTIEGAETSQFENHLRAVCGLPLGSTAARGHCMMLNLIAEVPELAKLCALPSAHPHIYDKAPRAGRKVGHLTLRADSFLDLKKGLKEVDKALGTSLCKESRQGG